ncbi:MAG: hypothetical protein RLZZ77_2257 [Bacteroidota bacterium]|jgi:O-antigen/teichoic acid export membrane protein
MRKTFVSNLMLLLAVNLLVKPFYILFIESEIQNRTGSENFGTYFAILNLSFLINILLDLGTTNWNTKQVAQATDIRAIAKNPVVLLRLLLALIYLTIAFVVGWSIGYVPEKTGLLILLAVNQIIASGILFLRSYLTGLHCFKADSFISVLDKLILTIHMSLLLWLYPHEFNVLWLAAGQGIAYGLTFLTALFILAKKGLRFPLEGRVKETFPILGESFPFALQFFINMMVVRLDSILLERMASPEEAGIYAMSYRFFDAFNMLAYLFAVILLPMFSRQLHQKENVSPVLQISFQWMWVSTTLVAACALLFGENMLNLLYDNHVQDAYRIFPLLMVGCIAFSLQYIFGTLLTAHGSMKKMILFSSIGVIINVGINLFFIPRYGILGAAIANICAQWAMLLLQWFSCHQLIAIDMKGTYKKAAVYSMGLLLSTFAFTYYFKIDPNILKENAFPLGLFLILNLGIAIATRMLDVRGFVNLIRKGD